MNLVIDCNDPFNILLPNDKANQDAVASPCFRQAALRHLADFRSGRGNLWFTSKAVIIPSLLLCSRVT